MLGFAEPSSIMSKLSHMLERKLRVDLLRVVLGLGFFGSRNGVFPSQLGHLGHWANFPLVRHKVLSWCSRYYPLLLGFLQIHGRFKLVFLGFPMMNRRGSFQRRLGLAMASKWLTSWNWGCGLCAKQELCWKTADSAKVDPSCLTFQYACPNNLENVIIL